MGMRINRREFLGSGALAFAAAATGRAASEGAGQGAQDAPLRVGPPCLQAAAETTMGVSWHVSGLAKGAVEVADNPDFRASRIVRPGGYRLVPVDATALQVRLEGLRPATRYWYRTITTPFTGIRNISAAKPGDPVVSATHSFTTLGPRAKAHFCVINDTHAQWKSFELVTAKVRELAPSAVVWNGDATDSTHDKETAARVFLDPPIADREWSSDVPVLFENGNHDFRGSWAPRMEEVMLARHPAERSGDQWDLRWNFAVRLGEVALIGMDTGEDKPDGHPFWFDLANFTPYRRAQAKWLEAALRRPDIAKARYRVMFCHIPLVANIPAHTDPPWDGSVVDPAGFAYWSRECRDLWAPIMERGRVDLLIAAHQHWFSCKPPEPGRRWAQMTGGGPELVKPGSGLFPTVIEGAVRDGKLVLTVHDVLNRRIAGTYSC